MMLIIIIKIIKIKFYNIIKIIKINFLFYNYLIPEKIRKRKNLKNLNFSIM